MPLFKVYFWFEDEGLSSTDLFGREGIFEMKAIPQVGQSVAFQVIAGGKEKEVVAEVEKITYQMSYTDIDIEVRLINTSNSEALECKDIKLDWRVECDR